jgi:alpha-1,3-mannosyltransferase
MNVLLFAPGFAFIFYQQAGLAISFGNALVLAITQVILALPFLKNNPRGYVGMAFEFSREFLYRWTVNWRMIPEFVFIDKWFHVVLLTMHLFVLSLMIRRWSR